MDDVLPPFAVCSVLFGNHELPPLLAGLPDACAAVVLVDNSGDLTTTIDDPRVIVVRPGRNLGYPAGINAGLRALEDKGPFEVIVLANPDLTMTRGFCSRLVRAAASSSPTIAIPQGGDLGTGLNRCPMPVGSALALLTRVNACATWGSRSDYPSGSLVALNRSAMQILQTPDGLLRDSLFFMDDVDLGVRAREGNVGLVGVATTRDEVVHEVNGTAWRAPSIPFYFRRASKVRYWIDERPTRGGRAYQAAVLIEAALIWAVSRISGWPRWTEVRPACASLVRTRGRHPELDDQVLAMMSRVEA